MNYSLEDNTLFTLEELSQANPELMDRKSLQEDLNRLKGAVREVLTRQTNFMREFQAERALNAKWRDEMMEKLSSLTNEGSDESQSLLLRPSAPGEPQDPPFITIHYPEGKTEEIMVPRNLQRQLLLEKSYRPVIRLLLMYLHDDDVSFLRTCTLTGEKKGIKRKASTDGEEEAGSSNGRKIKQALPIRSFLIAQGVIYKLFPVNALDPEGRFLAEKDREKKFREAITKVLNDFSQRFDENGKIIEKSTKKQ